MGFCAIRRKRLVARLVGVHKKGLLLKRVYYYDYVDNIQDYIILTL